jgi:hypothetical protein
LQDELFGEQSARIAAIAKESWLNEYWLHVSSSPMEATSAVFSIQSAERAVDQNRCIAPAITGATEITRNSHEHSHEKLQLADCAAQDH